MSQLYNEVVDIFLRKTVQKNAECLMLQVRPSSRTRCSSCGSSGPTSCRARTGMRTSSSTSLRYEYKALSLFLLYSLSPFSFLFPFSIFLFIPSLLIFLFYSLSLNLSFLFPLSIFLFIPFFHLPFYSLSLNLSFLFPLS